MNNIEISINGYFKMNITHYGNGKELDKNEEKEVLSMLVSGDYTIGINSMTIKALNGSINTPKYKFTLEATNDVEYEFEEVE